MRYILLAFLLVLALATIHRPSAAAAEDCGNNTPCPLEPSDPLPGEPAPPQGCQVAPFR